MIIVGISELTEKIIKVAKSTGVEPEFICDLSGKIKKNQYKGVVVKLMSEFQSGSVLLAIENPKARKTWIEENGDADIIPPLMDKSSKVSANVDEGTIIMDFVRLPKGVTVGKHCVIEGSCIVGKKTTIGDYVHIGEDCKIGEHVSIGEGAVIGDGSMIASGSVIGAWANVSRKTYVGKDVEPLGVASEIHGKL